MQAGSSRGSQPPAEQARAQEAPPQGPTPGSAAGPPTLHPAAALALQTAQVMAALGRTDLQQRLKVAAARVTRPNTVVCVAGEFKQGKSSLINALLGREICPVDDDLATSAVTLVHYSDQEVIQVRRREGERVVVEPAQAAALPELVSEAGNPHNARGIERVDVGIPHPFLKRGLALVDTPGMGSIGAGHSAATLAFLPFADGVIFVTDASAELSAPEREFLHKASALCPTVIGALTKVDISPHWRQIAELDRAHLERAGLGIPLWPVASPLRRTALRAGDAALDAESGFVDLTAALDERVIGPAKDLAGQRARDEVASVLEQLLSTLRTELSLLEQPAGAPETLAAMREATARLEHLRGPGARWNTLVGDRMTDLANEASYRFRSSLRTVAQLSDEQIEALKTPAQWEELGRRLSSAVADAVAAVFATLEAGAASLRREVVDLLAEESIELGRPMAGSAPLDVAALWRAPPITEKSGVMGGVLGQSLTGLRGAQSGILLFGMMGSFLPAALGALVLSAPITLGLGAAFAGGQLIAANRRKIEQRRQKAKAAVRQFIDDVQFEVGNELGEVVRRIQREIRDEFTERVTELQRTYAETAQRAQADVQRDDATRARRKQEVRTTIARLESLQRAGSDPGGAAR